MLIKIIAVLGTATLVIAIINYLKLKKMAGELDAIKAKVQAQGAALDTVSTNVDGIKADVKFLKDKLANAGTGGIPPEEVQALSDAVDSVSAKIDAIGSATASLDAETDSSGTT